MPDEPTYTEAEQYRMRVMHGVMDAVGQAGSIEGATGGIIDLDAAIGAICDAITALENASGVSQTARERREIADFCRKRIIEAGNAFARSAAEGKPLPWRMEPIASVS